jgi:uncharacterized protein
MIAFRSGLAVFLIGFSSLLICCSNQEESLHGPVETLRKASEEGDPEAQYQYALQLAEGKGVPKDEAAAALWLKKAVQKGHSQSLLKLAEAYARGLGVPKDPALASQLFQSFANQQNSPGEAIAKAAASEMSIPSRPSATQDPSPPPSPNTQANKGSSIPILQEGVEYDVGLFNMIKTDEISRQPEKAVTEFSREARSGNALAQVNLGIMLAEGIGTKQDMQEGLAWLYLAEKQGNVMGTDRAIATLEQVLGPSGVSQARSRSQQLGATIKNP